MALRSRILRTMIFICLFLVLGYTPSSAQQVLNNVSILRCTSQGMRLDAANSLDISSREKEKIIKEIQSTTIALDKLNREYNQNYRNLQSQIESRSRVPRIQRLAQEVGKLEGRRVGEILELELTIRGILDGQTYQQYRQNLTRQLEERINEWHRRLIPQDRDIHTFHHPRISIQNDPVNFCSILPQPDSRGDS